MPGRVETDPSKPGWSIDRLYDENALQPDDQPHFRDIFLAAMLRAYTAEMKRQMVHYGYHSLQQNTLWFIDPIEDLEQNAEDASASMVRGHNSHLMRLLKDMQDKVPGQPDRNTILQYLTPWYDDVIEYDETTLVPFIVNLASQQARDNFASFNSIKGLWTLDPLTTAGCDDECDEAVALSPMDDATAQGWRGAFPAHQNCPHSLIPYEPEEDSLPDANGVWNGGGFRTGSAKELSAAPKIEDIKNQVFGDDTLRNTEGQPIPPDWQQDVDAQRADFSETNGRWEPSTTNPVNEFLDQMPEYYSNDPKVEALAIDRGISPDWNAPPRKVSDGLVGVPSGAAEKMYSDLSGAAKTMNVDVVERKLEEGTWGLWNGFPVDEEGNLGRGTLEIDKSLPPEHKAAVLAHELSHASRDYFYGPTAGVRDYLETGPIPNIATFANEAIAQLSAWRVAQAYGIDETQRLFGELDYYFLNRPGIGQRGRERLFAVMNRPDFRDTVSNITDNLLSYQRPEEIRPITAEEARGNSREVSGAEFNNLALEGRQKLIDLSTRTPTRGLDDDWANIRQDVWGKVQESWGGATIDAHTGKALESDADLYALTVKQPGMETVRIPETASQQDFYQAMKDARTKFGDELQQEQRYLGIFHDDDLGVIDIDPVLVVDNLHDVDTIGSWTHAVGGAYHFKSGDGFWPPHIAAERAEATITHSASEAYRGRAILPEVEPLLEKQRVQLAATYGRWEPELPADDVVKPVEDLIQQMKDFYTDNPSRIFDTKWLAVDRGVEPDYNALPHKTKNGLAGIDPGVAEKLVADLESKAREMGIGIERMPPEYLRGVNGQWMGYVSRDTGFAKVREPLWLRDEIKREVGDGVVGEIDIRNDLSAGDEARTIAHELVHAAENYVHGDYFTRGYTSYSREGPVNFVTLLEEARAELGAWRINQKYGIDQTQRSLGFLDFWFLGQPQVTVKARQEFLGALSDKEFLATLREDLEQVLGDKTPEVTSIPDIHAQF